MRRPRAKTTNKTGQSKRDASGVAAPPAAPSQNPATQGGPFDIDARLGTLESSGLIRLAQNLPDLEYLFRHALLQDAAYGSLLRDDRRTQHRLVGGVLERLYPDRLDELAAVLALHFDAAGEDARALSYYTRAGDFALRRYANAEAIAHYSQALELAGRSPASSEAPLLHLFKSLGRAFELSGQFERALANYSTMETVARERDDRALSLAALLARATILATPSAVHDSRLAMELSQQALTLSRALADRQAQSKILWNLMLLCQFTGHMQDAVAYGEQSLTLAHELGLREQLAYTLNDIMRAYLGVGKFARAREVLDEARALWRALGNVPMVTDNLGRSARIFCAIGEYDKAIAAADEARGLSESIGNLWGQAFSRMFVGMVYFDRGEVATAIKTMEDCIRIGAQAGLFLALVGARADVAVVYGHLGDLDTGLALCRLADATAAQRMPAFQPWSLGSLARLQVMQGDLSGARATVEKAYNGLELDDFSTPGAVLVRLADAELALALGEHLRAQKLMEELSASLRRVGVRSWLTDALYLKARALQAQAETEAAISALGDARAEAESVGSRWMLWQILATLSAIAEEQDRHAEASVLRAQAREYLAFIVNHIPTPELSATFLQQPLARTIWVPLV